MHLQTVFFGVKFLNIELLDRVEAHRRGRTLESWGGMISTFKFPLLLGFLNSLYCLDLLKKIIQVLLDQMPLPRLAIPQLVFVLAEHCTFFFEVCDRLMIKTKLLNYYGLLNLTKGLYNVI